MNITLTLNNEAHVFLMYAQRSFPFKSVKGEEGMKSTWIILAGVVLHAPVQGMALSGQGGEAPRLAEVVYESNESNNQ